MRGDEGSGDDHSVVLMLDHQVLVGNELERQGWVISPHTGAKIALNGTWAHHEQRARRTLDVDSTVKHLWPLKAFFFSSLL